MDRRLLAAATVVAGYLGLNLLATTQDGPIAAFDLYNFMAFGHHYADHWFSTTIPRLGGGLDISSYPPLAFHLIALLSYLPLLTVESATILVVAASTGLLALAATMYIGSVVPVEDRSLVVLVVGYSPPVLFAAFIFGQLTTLLGMAFGFAALTYLNRYLDSGSREILPRFGLALALTGFTHHFSLLLILVLGGVAVLTRHSAPISRFRDLALTGVAAGILVVIGILPVVRALLLDGIVQARIPHLSRYPLADVGTAVQFLVLPFLFAIPALLYPFRSDDRPVQIYWAAPLFAVLGLGLTTPLPRLLFGPLATWLTYDRFTFVAAILLTGLAAVLADREMSDAGKPVVTAAAVMLGITVMFTGHLLFFGDMTGGEHTAQERDFTLQFLQVRMPEGYRYQTFGYGAPVGDLYAYTDAPTLDTDYHSGRTLPWIASAGVGPLDDLSVDHGREFFDTFMNRSHEYGVRYIFTYQEPYHRWMNGTGWELIQRERGVWVWRGPSSVPRVQIEEPDDRHVAFGTVPILTLAVFLLVVLRDRLPASVRRRPGWKEI